MYLYNFWHAQVHSMIARNWHGGPAHAWKWRYNVVIKNIPIIRNRDLKVEFVYNKSIVKPLQFSHSFNIVSIDIKSWVNYGLNARQIASKIRSQTFNKHRWLPEIKRISWVKKNVWKHKQINLFLIWRTVSAKWLAPPSGKSEKGKKINTCKTKYSYCGITHHLCQQMWEQRSPIPTHKPPRQCLEVHWDQEEVGSEMSWWNRSGILACRCLQGPWWLQSLCHFLYLPNARLYLDISLPHRPALWMQ
jgi:hypothetical protein